MTKWKAVKIKKKAKTRSYNAANGGRMRSRGKRRSRRKSNRKGGGAVGEK